MGMETDRRGPGRAASDIAPAPQFAERAPYVYERKFSPANPGNRGPLRFEEGLATDTAVPDDFMQGMSDGYMTPPGRPNHNMNVYEKYPDETMQQRMHPGSAAWVEAPAFLSGFVAGTMEPPVNYPQVNRSGAHTNRMNPATILD